MRQRGARRGVSGRSASGSLGVSLAFGLTVLTGAYALGPISGGHFNPAVTVGLWAGGRFPATRRPRLRHRPGRRRHRRRRRAVSHRERQGGIRPLRRLRVERLRRAFARRLLADRRPGHRDRHDVHVPDRHPRHDAPARARRLRGPRDRPRADAHPPHQHPGHEHVGEPGAQHRARRSSSAAGRRRSSGSSGSRRSSARSLPAASTARVFEAGPEPDVAGR